MGAWVVDFGRGGEGLYGRAGEARLDGGDDGDGCARRKVEMEEEMEEEMEGIGAMMEALLSLGPEESRHLGPFLPS
jgi:hypothetical protein